MMDYTAFISIEMIILYEWYDFTTKIVWFYYFAWLLKHPDIHQRTSPYRKEYEVHCPNAQLGDLVGLFFKTGSGRE